MDKLKVSRVMKLMLSSWQEFTATGSSNTDTDNTLGTEVSMEDQVRETLYSENVSALGMRKYY